MKKLLLLLTLAIATNFSAIAENNNDSHLSFTTTVTGTCSNCVCTEQSDGSYDITVTCTGSSGTCITFSGGTMTTTCQCNCGGSITLQANTPYPYVDKNIHQITSTSWEVSVSGITIQ